MDSSSAACALCTLRLRISTCPSRRIRAWSPVLNYFLPQRDATRFPVTTQDDTQFYQADIVVLGIASPTCLTDRQTIKRVGTLEVAPWKRSRMEKLFRDSLTGRNASPMSGVTRWKILLLMERLLHTSVCCLRMSSRHPRQHFYLLLEKFPQRREPLQVCYCKMYILSRVKGMIYIMSHIGYIKSNNI